MNQIKHDISTDEGRLRVIADTIDILQLALEPLVSPLVDGIVEENDLPDEKTAEYKGYLNRLVSSSHQQDYLRSLADFFEQAQENLEEKMKQDFSRIFDKETPDA